MGDLRNQQNALRDQVAALPKPLTSSQTQDIAHTEAIGALDEAQRRNKKFSIVGVNIGPTFGAGAHRRLQLQRTRPRSSRRSAATARTRCRRRASTVYYSGRQEGQFDLGLVNRWGNVQAGAFGSFKYLNFKDYQSGGGLGQAAFLIDYVFSRGRIGLFGTKGFKNYAVLNSVQLGTAVVHSRPTRASSIRPASARWSASGAMPTWKATSATCAATATATTVRAASFKLVQPLNEHVAFTAEAGLQRDAC